MDLRRLLCVSALVLVAAPRLAAAKRSPNCSDAAHRAWDFWVGKWDVTVGDKLLGHSTIALEYNDCVLHEYWSDAEGGGQGSSFSAYDPARKAWHQTWVDDDGVLLLLDGKVEKGELVLTGNDHTTAGVARRHLLIWSAQPDGTVHEEWRVSVDSGHTWKTRVLVFKRAGAAPKASATPPAKG